MNVTVYEKAHCFTTPRIYNHSATATSYQFPLVNGSIQYQHNTKTHMVYQKILTSIKDFLCF